MSLLLLFLFWVSFANNCIQKDLWDITSANICVNTKGNGSDQYITIEATCEDILCVARHCHTESSLSRCNRLNINYNNLTTKEILVYIELDGMATNYFFRWIYDFQNQTWLDDEELNDYNNTKNSTYVDVSAKTTLDVWESTDLIIKTNKDYTWDIFINETSYSRAWQVGTYYYDSSHAWWKYTMKSSDNWIKVLSNFIKFDFAGGFEFRIRNSENISDSITFIVKEPYIIIDDDEEENDLYVDDENDVDDEDENNEDDEEENNVDDEKNNFEDKDNYADKSRYEEWNQNTILSNWYSRELNNSYKFAYINWITTMKNIEQANMNWNLNRISMAKMLSQYAINILKKTPDVNKKCNFSDVTMKMDGNYSNWVTLACQLWIMWVWMLDFRPNDNVTRAEFWTALSRMLYWTPDDKYLYYTTHLQLLNKLWIINNTDPTLNELRWYVMLMLMRSALK